MTQEPKKLKISNKVIVISLVVLAVIIGITAYINVQSQDSDDNKEGTTFTVSRDGEVIASYTLDEIKKMPKIEVEANLRSSDKGDTEGTFTCVPIENLLNKTDESLLEDCGQFIFVAGDSFSAAVTKEEINKGENVLLAYAMDGKEFEHFSEGGQGPMRIIILSDTYGNRSVRWAVKVECK